MFNLKNIKSIEELVKIATEINEEETKILEAYKDFILSIDLSGIKRKESTQQNVTIPVVPSEICSNPNGLFVLLANRGILRPALLSHTMGPLWKDIYWHPTAKRPYVLTDINALEELQNYYS